MPDKKDTIKVVDGRLVVDVALTEGQPSATGKTTVFFSTHGNVSIGDGYVLGVNLYKPRK